MIPAHSKDTAVLRECVKSVRKYFSNVRKIYVVSSGRLLTDEEERESGVVYFDEALYPFNVSGILSLMPTACSCGTARQKQGSQGGWLLQQLLKLYAPVVLPGALPDVVVVDADTIWFEPVSFFGIVNGTELGLYAYDTKNLDELYWMHAWAAAPGLRRVLRHM